MRAIIFLFLMMFFVGCGEEKRVEKIQKQIPPLDVPIAKSDANISVNKDFPPIPVAE